MSKGMKEKSACAEKQVDSHGWSRTAGRKVIGDKAGPGSWDWIVNEVIDVLRN